jgi:type III secretory pathway component EscV
MPAVACASVWLAYGLCVGFPNLIFMMGACVVVTFIVLFTAELLSMVRRSGTSS